MAVKIVMVTPFLNDRRQWLADNLIVPVEIAASPTFREEDACPLLPGAEIALTSHWSKAMGEAAGDLRLIQMPGAGWDKMDATAIPDGVLVANCYEHEQGIAEYVVMMCLALARELLKADRTIRQGNWKLFPALGYPFFPELGGQTIGIIGLGRIGKAVAKLTSGFNMRRIALDAFPVPDDVKESLQIDWIGGISDLDRLLGESDFVVISAPYSDETRGMLGKRELSLLKPTAFLINPARAEIVDEEALYEALRDKVFAGAALDPWWHYPKTNECVAPSRFPFADLDNVIMTPHTSGSTAQTIDRRLDVMVANLNRYFRGESVVNVVQEMSRV